MKLSEGQGAELLWRDSPDKAVTPGDALRIYALKTAPAFEAALYAGLRLAHPIDGYREPIGEFARHLGVAFQILNDLGDWQADDHNKLLAGGDIIGGRPTVLWALALEGLGPPHRAELHHLAAQQPITSASLVRIRQLYQQAGVFEKAAQLVDNFKTRAQTVAAALQPDELRRLLAYLIDMVLDRQIPVAHQLNHRPAPQPTPT
jgi:geranylgeranyl pyrophosphate synthase